MDFFAAQGRSRRRSRRLLWLFALATLLIVVVVTGVLAVLFAAAGDSLTWLLEDPSDWLVTHAPLLLGAAALTAVLVLAASLIRTRSLASGGGQVARAVGGVEVSPDTADPRLRQLRNVVEEIAIASGVPVPEIYVLPNEPGINAFAAGYSPGNAAVAVTQGALEQLSRDELQGVLAHEFSHILNGDMRINIRLMGLLFGILVVGLAGRLMLHSARFSAIRAAASRRNNSGGGGGNALALLIPVAGLLLIVIGGIGVFFGRLIRAGVSREREYLADASAVQFTRNNHGIAGALKKIGGYPAGSDFKTADSEEVSHMLFARGGAMFSGWFATHPPLPARIAALDRDFAMQQRAGVLGGAAVGSGPMHTGASGLTSGLVSGDASGMVLQAGQVGEAHLAYAAQLRASLPAELEHAVHSYERAGAVVLALLLDPTGARRKRQIAAAGAFADPALLESLSREIETLGPGARLPLLELAFPALKHRPDDELQAWMSAAERVGRTDAYSPFAQYCLLRLLRHYVVQAQQPSRRAPRAPTAAQMRAALTDLFRVFASQGAADETQARAAFDAGRAAYAVASGAADAQQLDDYRSADDWQSLLDTALVALAGMPLESRRATLEGLVAIATHDHQLRVSEYELLRVLCADLDVPLPPAVSAMDLYSEPH